MHVSSGAVRKEEWWMTNIFEVMLNDDKSHRGGIWRTGTLSLQLKIVEEL